MNATATCRSIVRLLLVLVVGALAIVAILGAAGAATQHGSSSTAAHMLAGGKCRGCV